MPAVMESFKQRWQEILHAVAMVLLSIQPRKYAVTIMSNKEMEGIYHYVVEDIILIHVLKYVATMMFSH
jgi:hypothetical protein